MGKRLLWISLVLLAGCASTFRQEGLTATDPSGIAVLEVVELPDNQALLIGSIDGKWRGVGSFKRYELLPGERAVELSYVGRWVYSTKALVLSFNAEAGHTYRMRAITDRTKMIWTAQIFDVQTSEVVSKKSGNAS